MPSQRLTAPFRAETIGSFARPKSLINKQAEYTVGKCSHDDLVRCEDEAVAGIVAFQKQLGLKVINDGELRRYVLLILHYLGVYTY